MTSESEQGIAPPHDDAAQLAHTSASRAAPEIRMNSYPDREQALFEMKASLHNKEALAVHSRDGGLCQLSQSPASTNFLLEENSSEMGADDIFPRDAPEGVPDTNSVETSDSVSENNKIPENAKTISELHNKMNCMLDRMNEHIYKVVLQHQQHFVWQYKRERHEMHKNIEGLKRKSSAEYIRRVKDKLISDLQDRLDWKEEHCESLLLMCSQNSTKISKLETEALERKQEILFLKGQLKSIQESNSQLCSTDMPSPRHTKALALSPTLLQMTAIQKGLNRSGQASSPDRSPLNGPEARRCNPDECTKKLAQTVSSLRYQLQETETELRDLKHEQSKDAPTRDELQTLLAKSIAEERNTPRTKPPIDNLADEKGHLRDGTLSPSERKPLVEKVLIDRRVLSGLYKVLVPNLSVDLAHDREMLNCDSLEKMDNDDHRTSSKGD